MGILLAYVSLIYNTLLAGLHIVGRIGCMEASDYLEVCFLSDPISGRRSEIRGYDIIESIEFGYYVLKVPLLTC